MTSLRKVALLTVLAASLGASVGAVAHGPGSGPGGGCATGTGMMQGMGPGMGSGMGPGMRGRWGPGAGTEDFAKFQEERLAALKDRLKITPEQETAWNAFAATAKEHRPGTMGPPAAGTGPDAFAGRIERMKERVASMEKMQGAYKQLYEVLTPAQRETFGSGFGPHWGWRS